MWRRLRCALQGLLDTDDLRFGTITRVTVEISVAVEKVHCSKPQKFEG
jgi:hypothetical protein